MSDVAFVTKLHEASCMIKDACEEYLEKHPTLSQLESHRGDGLTWDPSKIKWADKTGANGPFQIGELEPNNPDFQAMTQDLRDHNGKMTKEGFFYWFFTGAETVGRKKKA
jgi:hypothetical protein